MRPGDGIRQPQAPPGRGHARQRRPEGPGEKKLLTPDAKRRAVRHVMTIHGSSKRRACELMALDRSTFQYHKKPDTDAALRERLKVVAGERRQFGYRRLSILLRREGFLVNHKKLFHLYREEGLAVRRRRGRKRAVGTRKPRVMLSRPYERWGLDFVSDSLADGRRFRVFEIERAVLERIARSAGPEEEYNSIEYDLLDSGRIFGLDVGVASTVVALPAARCVPFSSCNGGAFGGSHYEGHPVVGFFGRPEMAELLLHCARESDAGLRDDYFGVLVVCADDIRKMRMFADAVIRRRASFRQLRIYTGVRCQSTRSYDEHK